MARSLHCTETGKQLTERVTNSFIRLSTCMPSNPRRTLPPLPLATQGLQSHESPAGRAESARVSRSCRSPYLRAGSSWQPTSTSACMSRSARGRVRHTNFPVRRCSRCLPSTFWITMTRRSHSSELSGSGSAGSSSRSESSQRPRPSNGTG